jgi:stage II sporulation protein D
VNRHRGRIERYFHHGQHRRMQSVLAAAIVALAASGDARAEGPVVRVLLERALGGVRVGLPDGSSVQLSAPGPTGPSWESPHTGTHRYAEWTFFGRLRVVRTGGTVAVIALVPLEHYVEGAVGREMPTSWDREALRAQAIVSRTYALRAVAHPADPAFDVEATTTSQVFGGAEAAAPSVRAAVAATRGQYLAYGGEPILAVFHSASGGRTAGAEEVWGDSLPYLRSIAVEDEDEAPSTYWRVAVSRTTLRRALAQLGLDVGRDPQLVVAERGPSGRVRRLELRGPAGTRRLSGELLRQALGPDVVKSTLFELRDRGVEVVLVGSGHGHGVGMSQWGAKAMAEGGASHLEILATFYPGTTLERAGRERATAASSAAGGGA